MVLKSYSGVMSLGILPAPAENEIPLKGETSASPSPSRMYNGLFHLYAMDEIDILESNYKVFKMFIEMSIEMSTF